MTHVIITGTLLATGLALALYAGRRGWRPSLAVALATGVALRALALLIAARDSWQPVDFMLAFKPAAEDVLNRQDPVLSPGSGWHFLPMSAYALALMMATGLAWEIAGRLYPLIADVVLIVLVGRLATDRGELRRFQYACLPLPIMVSTIHGQLEPVALAFGVAAFLAARRARGLGAGTALGFALAANSWPVLLLPGVLKTLPDTGSRIRALAAAVAVPAVFFVSLPLVVGTPLNALPDVVRVILGIRPVIGDWGWTALATGGEVTLDSTLAGPGSYLLFATLIVVGWLWRRAHPVDLTSALLLAFLVVTPRLGAQYLMFAVPFLVARPTRGTQPALAASALWAAIGYLYLTRLDQPGWVHAHGWWAISSIAVIPFLVWAMPWSRRDAGAVREQTPEVAGSPAGSPEGAAPAVR